MAITNLTGSGSSGNGSSNLALSLKIGASQSIVAAELLGDLDKPASAYTFKVGRSSLGPAQVDTQGNLIFSAVKAGRGSLTVDILEDGKRVATRRVTVEALPLSTRIETFSNLNLTQPRVTSFSTTSFISLFENEGLSFKPGAVNLLPNISKQYQLNIEELTANRIRIGAYDNRNTAVTTDDERLQIIDLEGTFTLSDKQELLSGVINRIDGKFIDTFVDPDQEVTDFSIQDIAINLSGKDLGQSFLGGLQRSLNSATEFRGSNTTGDLADEDVAFFFSDDVRGSSKVDQLYTGAGDDVIWAGAGNDLIDAGTGADQINSGIGRDDITGGLGADTFIYDAASALNRSLSKVDVIRDFKAEEGDVIEIKRSAFRELKTFGPGALAAENFVLSIGAKDAANKTPVFGFDATTGALFYQGKAGDPRSIRYIATLEGVSKFDASSIRLV